MTEEKPPYDLCVYVYGTHVWTPKEMERIEDFFNHFSDVQHVAQEMRINTGKIIEKAIKKQDAWLLENDEYFKEHGL